MNEAEKNTVSKMIKIYCQAKHSGKELCEECRNLEIYACERLQKCYFGNEKPTCRRCPKHCYKKDMKNRIQQVMRFAGPRMIYRYPMVAIRHIFSEIRK